MRLTLETDYAVRIVGTLASAGKMDAQSIADDTGVTLRFSLKILRKLVAAGIVRSYKGAKGGYEIARDPAEISLYDVVEVVEGPISLARCSADVDCPHGQVGLCRFRDVLEEASRDFREKLAARNFGEMARPDKTEE